MPSRKKTVIAAAVIAAATVAAGFAPAIVSAVTPPSFHTSVVQEAGRRSNIAYNLAADSKIVFETRFHDPATGLYIFSDRSDPEGYSASDATNTTFRTKVTAASGRESAWSAWQKVELKK